jgi:hypothetical protein
MPSTTGSSYDAVLSGTRSPRGLPYEWATGFSALERLLDRGGLPSTLETELSLLITLRHLHNETLPAEARGRREEFERRVESVGPAEVEAILAWIGRPSRLARFLPGYARHQRTRALLAFVLMAAIVARYFRFAILRRLDDLGALGGYEQLDDLLSWVRAPFLTSSERTVARAYLDLSRRVLFEHLEQRMPPLAGVAPSEFTGWPWTRQLQALQTLRERWSAQAGRRPGEAWASPAIHADTLEFQLAHRGLFRGLARRGGWIAREALASWGYSDWSPTDPVLLRRHAALFLLLIAATAVTVTATVWRLHAWDRSGLAMAQTIAERIGK